MGDGQDGSQAYVAVGDVVYDVTDAEVLDNVPIVGTVDRGE